MPVFGNPGNVPSTSLVESTRDVRFIQPQLAEGTDTRPTLVQLPSQGADSRIQLGASIFAPQAIPGFVGVPSLGSSSLRAGSILANSNTNTGLLSSRPQTGAPTGQPLALSGNTNVGPSQGTPTSLNRFAESIARIESGGRYDAVGPNTRYGTAKGKYQFIDDTWRRAASLVGGAGRYRNALQAPPEVQDAVAIAWFQSLLRRYNGNYEAVAIAHHAGEGTADRFIRTGSVGTSDVLGTRTSDYARNALNGAFG